MRKKELKKWDLTGFEELGSNGTRSRILYKKGTQHFLRVRGGTQDDWLIPILSQRGAQIVLNEFQLEAQENENKIKGDGRND